MSNIRVIARLDIKGPNLVKGVHLEGLRVLGKPWSFAMQYYHDGIDELLYIDAVASLYGRNNILDIVNKTAEHIFIPLTVGGGVRSIDDIRNLLRAGADKVAINTAAVINPHLITEGAKVFGSQCIVASIQSKLIDGKYFAYTDNARESTDIEVLPWAQKLVELGAGEIIVTSIDREGTGKGYDINLIHQIATSVPVPVIACGGCGKKEHLLDAIIDGSANAVCASSIFHYEYVKKLADEEVDEYKTEGNIEFIKSNRGTLDFLKSRLETTTIHAAKEFLVDKGVNCRNDGVWR